MFHNTSRKRGLIASTLNIRASAAGHNAESRFAEAHPKERPVRARADRCRVCVHSVTRKYQCLDGKDQGLQAQNHRMNEADCIDDVQEKPLPPTDVLSRQFIRLLE